MPLQRNRALVSATPMTPQTYPADLATQTANAIKSGRIGEQLQKILYDRVLIDPPAGGTVLARTIIEAFVRNRASNPESTNLVEGQRMGPNESFTVEGVALQVNFGCTAAGLTKFLQDARLRIGVGPDDVERLCVPAIFLPSGNGPIADLTAQIHNAFYRLSRGQEITLQPGTPFSVRLIQGPNAPSLADVDVVDIFIKLFGTYQQSVVR